MQAHTSNTTLERKEGLPLRDSSALQNYSHLTKEPTTETSLEPRRLGSKNSENENYRIKAKHRLQRKNPWPRFKKKKKNCEKQQNRTRDRIWRTTEFGNRNDLLLYTLLITCKYDSKYTSADKKYNL